MYNLIMVICTYCTKDLVIIKYCFIIYIIVLYVMHISEFS